MKIYRILGSKGNTTVPWQIRDAMDLRASDVISFEYGSFGEDVIVLRRELCADGGLGDYGYPDISNIPDGGEFADELEDEPNEDLEVKALLDFISGFSEKAQRSALMQVLLLLPGENGNHIAGVLFKQGVELAILMHVIAASQQYDPDSLEELRKHCVNEVRKYSGRYRFEDAVAFQNS